MTVNFEAISEERDRLENARLEALRHISKFNHSVKKELIDNGLDEALTINWSFINRQIHIKRRIR